MKLQFFSKLLLLLLLQLLSAVAVNAKNLTSSSDVVQSSSASTSLDDLDLEIKKISQTRFNNFESSMTTPLGTSNLDFETIVDIYDVNGLGMIIIEGGQITQERYYGYETINRIVPVSDTTRFQAASMSKFVAGLAAAIAHEEGTLKLGKKVSVMANQNPDTLLDKWRNKKFSNSEESYTENISVKKLLNHAAGLNTWGIGTAAVGEAKRLDQILLGDDFFSASDGVQPIYEPDTVWEYSGGGYTVFEHMLEMASGQSYADYATENILEVAYMGKSTFDEITSTTPNLAWGCSWVCDWEPEQTLVKAAGGLISTPKNFAKLLFPLINEGNNRFGNPIFDFDVIKNVLTPANRNTNSNNSCSVDSDCPINRTIDLGFTSYTVPANEICFQNQCKNLIVADSPTVGEFSDAYGLGVFLDGEFLEDGYHRYVWHAGDQTGFHSYFRIDRKTKNGIVFMIAGTDNISRGTIIDGYGSLPLKTEMIRKYIQAYE